MRVARAGGVPWQAGPVPSAERRPSSARPAPSHPSPVRPPMAVRGRSTTWDAVELAPVVLVTGAEPLLGERAVAALIGAAPNRDLRKVDWIRAGQMLN